jgi:hypothetical protein
MATGTVRVPTLRDAAPMNDEGAAPRGEVTALHPIRAYFFPPSLSSSSLANGESDAASPFFSVVA